MKKILVLVVVVISFLSGMLLTMHKHQWQESTRYFVPPVSSFEARWIDAGTVYKLVNGYTVIELRCTKCGDIKTKVFTGDLIK